MLYVHNCLEPPSWQYLRSRHHFSQLGHVILAQVVKHTIAWLASTTPEVQARWQKQRHPALIGSTPSLFIQ
jgi:hypothetical protein